MSKLFDCNISRSGSKFCSLCLPQMAGPVTAQFMTNSASDTSTESNKSAFQNPFWFQENHSQNGDLLWHSASVYDHSASGLQGQSAACHAYETYQPTGFGASSAFQSDGVWWCRNYDPELYRNYEPGSFQELDQQGCKGYGGGYYPGEFPAGNEVETISPWTGLTRALEPAGYWTAGSPWLASHWTMVPRMQCVKVELEDHDVMQESNGPPAALAPPLIYEVWA